MIQFHGIYPIKGLVLKSQPCAKNTALTQNSATFRPFPGHMQRETLVIAVATSTPAYLFQGSGTHANKQ